MSPADQSTDTAPSGPERARPLGFPRLHLRTVDSTNERARSLAAAGAPHGTLVTAAQQTAGRGRHGRGWSAPAGRSLLMSLVVRQPPSLLPLAAGVAVCDAVGDQARVKWPNDVVIERTPDPVRRPGQDREPEASGLAKLAGILVEGRPQEGWAVVGIGLNVAVRPSVDLRTELRGTAASLEREPEAVEELLAAVLAALEDRLGQEDGEILAAWGERDALRGRHVSWAGGSGRAEGVDDGGRLVIALEGGGCTRLTAGEVHLRAELG